MSAKKNAKGGGTIRKKTVTRNGKEYTYWEARITTGRDPGTGKQIQRSFTGKTQKEVREKMQAAAVEVNQGTYTAPQKMTVGQWLDIWQRDYLGQLKPATVTNYARNIKNYIKSALGAVRLDQLRPHDVQGFVNGLTGLAPSSVRLAYMVLHTALEKAVQLDYIVKSPADRCELPRQEREEVHPLDDEQAAALIHAAAGSGLEFMIPLALFTGLRLSELLGLTWDVVDFANGTITVDKQITYTTHRDTGLFHSPKNGKSRTISPAASAMATLKRQRAKQAEMRLRAGKLWADSHNLIFTSELGRPLTQQRIEEDFGKVRASAGLDGVRFHDLRHP